MVPLPPPPGRSFRVSQFGRLVIDLMHFSAQVPTVILESHMPLGPLVEARKGCAPPPSWTALFTRAFALVCACEPLLRTSYLKAPWQRFYERPHSVVTLNVAREAAGERVVLYANIEHPEIRSLRDIDAVLREHQEGPVEALPSYRNPVRLS